MWETWVLSLGLEDPWRRKWQPTPVFLHRKSHEQRSLEGYSPWGRRELDTTEQLAYIYVYIYMNGQGEPALTWGQGTWPNPCGSFVQSSTTWWPRCHRHDLLTWDGLGCMVAWIPRKVSVAPEFSWGLGTSLMVFLVIWGGWTGRYWGHGNLFFVFPFIKLGSPAISPLGFNLFSKSFLPWERIWAEDHLCYIRIFKNYLLLLTHIVDYCF